MEKIEHMTPDITQENIERLAELFPSVATEVADAEGKPQKAIDFDALRELLGDVAEGQRERYQFTWPGKREAKSLARTPCDKTMRPERDRSVNWDTTENLYIEGDNLEALKLMRETYAGKVKLIYIDPPYNTGHDFIYDDDFAQTRAEYDAESGDYDEQGGRLVANLEGNGRFHSDWCSMMYPRLLLARDLLSSDGAIFISIDDNESKNLRAICDEVFGAGCFAGDIAWQRTYSPRNDSLGIPSEVERIRRAGEKIAEEVEEVNKQLKLGEEPKPVPDIGFRVLRIDSSNFRDTYAEPAEQAQANLFDLVDNLKDDRTPEDLLFQVLPTFRIPYSAHIEAFEINGAKCFNVNDGQLIACFDTEVGTSVIERIAQERPIYAVFRDASLADDSAAANFEELFRTYSPDTIRRVI